MEIFKYQIHLNLPFFITMATSLMIAATIELLGNRNLLDILRPGFQFDVEST